MTLSPVLEAPPQIQLHLVAALLALLLGPLALYGPRRARWHRGIGYAWVAAMTITALSSFLIGHFRVIGPFSPIHALSVYALWSLWVGVGHARAGRAAAHARVMRGLYWWGLCLAGLFTLLPGRVLNRMLGDPWSDLAPVLILSGGAALAIRAMRSRDRGGRTGRI
ncbi:MAG: DUF2306 domain-containing protein [Marinibacterium sp.]|nr:DUF2306 domain-containing protein [Marinibacterium sp.]